MSVLIDENTRLVVQGITGRDGSFHAGQMIEYGTNVVAGVTPGKGGQKFQDKVPIFDSVAEAVKDTDANTSVIYVRAPFAPDAICEAADAGCKLIVCITEGVPVRDMTRVMPYIRQRGARLIGPNCPGIISPGKKVKVGILPAAIHVPGNVGVVSRSGTLTYEVVFQLTRARMGQSTCIGIGGDQVIGTNFIDALTMFQADEDTKAIVLIGEIGGSDEEEAAKFIEARVDKPVVSFIAGQTAPPGKRMGHAGAIVSGGSGTAAEKVAAFERVGVPVAKIPSEITKLLSEAAPGLSG
jgi:succinyl-CoA synthetase alpha subunit